MNLRKVLFAVGLAIICCFPRVQAEPIQQSFGGSRMVCIAAGDLTDISYLCDILRAAKIGFLSHGSISYGLEVSPKDIDRALELLRKDAKAVEILSRTECELSLNHEASKEVGEIVILLLGLESAETIRLRAGNRTAFTEEERRWLRLLSNHSGRLSDVEATLNTLRTHSTSDIREGFLRTISIGKRATEKSWADHYQRMRQRDSSGIPFDQWIGIELSSRFCLLARTLFVGDSRNPWPFDKIKGNVFTISKTATAAPDKDISSALQFFDHLAKGERCQVPIKLEIE